MDYSDNVPVFDPEKRNLLSSEAMIALHHADLYNSEEIETDLNSRGLTFNSLYNEMVTNFMNLLSDMTIADVNPEGIVVNVMHSIDNVIGSETEEFDPLRTILHIQTPEFVAAILLPLQSLTSIKDQSVALAHEGLMHMFLAITDDRIATKLITSYPKAMTRAGKHVAGILEKKASSSK